MLNVKNKNIKHPAPCVHILIGSWDKRRKSAAFSSQVWMFVQKVWRWTFTGIGLPFLLRSGSCNRWAACQSEKHSYHKEGREGSCKLYTGLGFEPSTVAEWGVSEESTHLNRANAQETIWFHNPRAGSRVCVWCRCVCVCVCLCDVVTDIKKLVESFLLPVKTQRVSEDEGEERADPEKQNRHSTPLRAEGLHFTWHFKN